MRELRIRIEVKLPLQDGFAMGAEISAAHAAVTQLESSIVEIAKGRAVRVDWSDRIVTPRPKGAPEPGQDLLEIPGFLDRRRNKAPAP